MAGDVVAVGQAPAARLGGRVLGGDGLLLGRRDQGPREVQGGQLRRGIAGVGDRAEQGQRLGQGAGIGVGIGCSWRGCG